MGIGKSVLDFLFGKDPDIFDENGRVRHKFTEAKWTAWNDRLKASPAYNWRKHSAQERIEKATPPPPSHSSTTPLTK